MRLRTNLRRPGRYREEDVEELPPNPTFVVPTTPFNPTLRPAVFPTLNWDELPPDHPNLVDQEMEEIEEDREDLEECDEEEEVESSDDEIIERLLRQESEEARGITTVSVTEDGPGLIQLPDSTWHSIEQPGDSDGSADNWSGESETDDDDNGDGMIQLPDDTWHSIEQPGEYDGFAGSWNKESETNDDDDDDDEPEARWVPPVFTRQQYWSDLTDGMQLVIMRELTYQMTFFDSILFLCLEEKEFEDFLSLCVEEIKLRELEDRRMARIQQRQMALIESGDWSANGSEWGRIIDEEISSGGGQMPATFLITRDDVAVAKNFLGNYRFREEFPDASITEENFHDVSKIPTFAILSEVQDRLDRYVGVDTTFKELNLGGDFLEYLPAEMLFFEDDEDSAAHGTAVGVSANPAASATSKQTSEHIPAPPTTIPMANYTTKKVLTKDIERDGISVDLIKKPKRGRPPKKDKMSNPKPSRLREVVNADEVQTPLQSPTLPITYRFPNPNTDVVQESPSRPSTPEPKSVQSLGRSPFKEHSSSTPPPAYCASFCNDLPAQPAPSSPPKASLIASPVVVAAELPASGLQPSLTAPLTSDVGPTASLRHLASVESAASSQNYRIDNNIQPPTSIQSPTTVRPIPNVQPSRTINSTPGLPPSPANQPYPPPTVQSPTSAQPAASPKPITGIQPPTSQATWTVQQAPSVQYYHTGHLPAGFRSASSILSSLGIRSTAVVQPPTNIQLSINRQPVSSRQLQASIQHKTSSQSDADKYEDAYAVGSPGSLIVPKSSMTQAPPRAIPDTQAVSQHGIKQKKQANPPKAPKAASKQAVRSSDASPAKKKSAPVRPFVPNARLSTACGSASINGQPIPPNPPMTASTSVATSVPSSAVQAPASQSQKRTPLPSSRPGPVPGYAALPNPSQPPQSTPKVPTNHPKGVSTSITDARSAVAKPDTQAQPTNTPNTASVSTSILDPLIAVAQSALELNRIDPSQPAQAPVLSSNSQVLATSTRGTKSSTPAPTDLLPSTAAQPPNHTGLTPDQSNNHINSVESSKQPKLNPRLVSISNIRGEIDQLVPKLLTKSNQLPPESTASNVSIPPQSGNSAPNPEALDVSQTTQPSQLPLPKIETSAAATPTQSNKPNTPTKIRFTFKGQPSPRAKLSQSQSSPSKPAQGKRPRVEEVGAETQQGHVSKKPRLEQNAQATQGFVGSIMGGVKAIGNMLTGAKDIKSKPDLFKSQSSANESSGGAEAHMEGSDPANSTKSLDAVDTSKEPQTPTKASFSNTTVPSKSKKATTFKAEAAKVAGPALLQDVVAQAEAVDESEKLAALPPTINEKTQAGSESATTKSQQSIESVQDDQASPSRNKPIPTEEFPSKSKVEVQITTQKRAASQLLPGAFEQEGLPAKKLNSSETSPFLAPVNPATPTRPSSLKGKGGRFVSTKKVANKIQSTFPFQPISENGESSSSSTAGHAHPTPLAKTGSQKKAVPKKAASQPYSTPDPETASQNGEASSIADFSSKTQSTPKPNAGSRKKPAIAKKAAIQPNGTRDRETASQNGETSSSIADSASITHSTPQPKAGSRKKPATAKKAAAQPKATPPPKLGPKAKATTQPKTTAQSKTTEASAAKSRATPKTKAGEKGFKPSGGAKKKQKTAGGDDGADEGELGGDA